MLYREGSHFYNGVEHQQTEPAFAVLEKIIKDNNVDQIIEIGTGMGGCTAFLSQFAATTTYDIIDRTEGKLKSFNKVDFRLEDCFSQDVQDHIKWIIKMSDVVFLMCDGEAKAEEVKLYAPMLKSGDIIFCHDWEDQFGWDDVKEAVGGNDFEPVEKELCDKNLTNLQGWRKK